MILHVDFLESIAPGLSWICRTLLESVYPKGFLTRRVNNSDISWHKDRVFISEVFRFEDLGFETVGEDFYRVIFPRSRNWRVRR